MDSIESLAVLIHKGMCTGLPRATWDDISEQHRLTHMQTARICLEALDGRIADLERKLAEAQATVAHQARQEIAEIANGHTPNVDHPIFDALTVLQAFKGALWKERDELKANLADANARYNREFHNVDAWHAKWTEQAARLAEAQAKLRKWCARWDHPDEARQTIIELVIERDAFKAKLAETQRKHYEAIEIMTAWKNIDATDAVAQMLEARRERDALQATCDARERLIRVYASKIQEKDAALEQVREWIRGSIQQTEKALGEDAPESTCAAHHRGTISGLRWVLGNVLAALDAGREAK